MTLTRARTIQYIGILLSLGLIAAGYWYFSVRAGVKTNTGGSQPQGGGDLSAGLAGYWKLDEGTGTSAADSSTNGNNGTLTNGPTWTTGQIGSAVDLDGNNDYVAVSDPASGVLDFDDAENFTFSVWFNRTTETTYDTVISKYNGSNVGYILSIGNSGDYLTLFVSDGTDSYTMYSNTSFTSPGWHHVVVTWDNGSEDNSRVYIDGLNDTTSRTGTFSAVGDLSNAATFSIGENLSSLNSFDGLLDEIRVYDRALSSEEVANLYRLTTPTGVDTGLKGYWSFNSEASSGTTAYDRSGAGNTGTLTNGPAITEGRVGQALSFDGSDDYVTVPTSSALSPTAQITISAWVKRVGTGVRQFVVSKGNATAEISTQYWLEFTAGNSIAFELDSGSTQHTLTSSSALTDTGGWHYIVGTYDGTTQRLYVDGVQDVNTLTWSGSINTTNDDLVLGNRSGFYNIPFHGLLDEVRVYNRALTAAEVKSFYDRGAPDRANTSAGQKQGTGNLDSGLFAYFPLDENTGTSTSDKSTNGLTGTLTNGPTWTTGQIGSAVSFDGTNDYITTAVTTFMPSSNTNHSGFAWIYPTALVASGYKSVISYGESDDSQWATGLALYDSTGEVVWTQDGFDAPHASSGFTVPLNQWSFVGFMRTDTDVTFFVNGAVSTVANSVYALIQSDPVLIGASGHNAVIGGYFSGYIDEARFYSRTLSTDEAARLYRLTTPTSVDTSLKGYWSFNGQDMSGTTAYDRSGAGNDGTLTNSPAIGEGRVGQAIQFDGSNDYVSTGNPSSLQLSTGTASAWVKTTSPGSTHRAILSKEDAYGLLFYNDILVAYDWNAGTERSTGIDITDGNWHHIAQTFQSGVAGGTTVYVDGVAVLSTTITVLGQTKPFQIGNSDGETQYLNGSVDEVRVYNRILSAAEIQVMYDAGAPDKVNTSASQSQGTGRLDSGLAGYWKLDETTGSTGVDSSTNGNNVTLSNTENGDWVAGQVGNAIDLDGSNESGLVSYSSALTSSTKLSYSFWASPDSNDNRGILGALNGEDGSLYNYIRIDNSGAEAGNPIVSMVRNISGSTTSRSVQFAYPVSTWFHYTYTYDGAFERVYINGALHTEWAQSGNFATNTEYGLFLGGDYTGGNVFDGRLDEVRIYNRALSTDEVGQLYRLATPTGTDTSLIGYWSFNGQDMSGTTAYDRSGAGNNGTLTGSPAVIEGRLGQALQFNGSNQGVVTEYNGYPANTFTESFWVKTSDTITLFTESTSGVDGVTGQRYALNAYRGEPPGLADGVSSGVSVGTNGIQVGEFDTSYFPILSSSAVSLGTGWNHVVVVYNSKQPSVYLNGIFVHTGLTSLATNVYPSRMIAENEYGDFAGVVDEVRLYNRALSASEIKELYASGK